jgi:hypothetical protein
LIERENFMARGPSLFKSRLFQRVVRAAKASGMSIAQVEVHPDGRIVVVHGTSISEPKMDALDQELAQFEARNGHG